MCTCVRACVRARACVREHACARALVFVCVRACVRMCVWGVFIPTKWPSVRF